MLLHPLMGRDCQQPSSRPMGLLGFSSPLRRLHPPQSSRRVQKLCPTDRNHPAGFSWRNQAKNTTPWCPERKASRTVQRGSTIGASDDSSSDQAVVFSLHSSIIRPKAQASFRKGK